MINEKNSQKAKNRASEHKSKRSCEPILFTARGDAIYECETARDSERKEQQTKKSLWQKIRSKDAGFWQAVFTALAFFALIAYTVYTRRQWLTLDRNVTDGERQFKQTLCQMKAQTAAQKEAADAARDSVNVTKSSLRARIVINPQPVDFPRKLVSLSVENTGKISSGSVEIICHKAILQAVNGQFSFAMPIECGWKRYRSPSYAIGSQFSIALPILKASESEFIAGKQGFIAAGYIIYNDGFPEDGIERIPFCHRTQYSPPANTLFFIPCEPGTIIPLLEKLDSYPKYEDQGCPTQGCGQ
jgi:hypothetical protein